MAKISKMKFSIAILLLLVSFTGYCTVAYFQQFTFNEDKALQRWKKMILNGEVTYALMKSGSDGFIQALSEKTSSAIYYRVGYNLAKYPTLSWKWKVLEFPDISRAKTLQEKDDYAARVYVIFPFLSFSSSKFLEYVWSENLPVGTILDSPFGKNIKMIVARSGKMQNEDWVVESRNVYEDYKKVFGAKPRGVGAIALMCDADGTKTQAKALFDEIVIGKE
ncbi:MAG: DUF3047 domain-containing protein [Candidatus Omnitrophota bacterium]|nr:DUF3047 domain-containing protein [Candidatus Omnitrophota bacterium]